MISRLTTIATAFAVLATASLTYAAGMQRGTPTAVAKQVRIVQLERVVVVAKRLPQQAI